MHFTAATPLSTPATTPCGNKYQTYSSIFFANFREEQQKQQQQRALREAARKQRQQQKQQQELQMQQYKLRSNVRLCRETAINNNNTNNDNQTQSSSFSNILNFDADNMQMLQENLDELNGNGNGNVAATKSASSSAINAANANLSVDMVHFNNINDDDAADDDDDDDDDMGDNVVQQHCVNGTFYTSGNQNNKIRITENPLPETISC